MAARRSVLAAVALSAVLLFAGTAGAGIIRVPIDQPTIAAALGIAQPGDEVELQPGTYYEHGLQVPCGVTLRGATGNPGCVIIDGQSVGSVLVIMHTVMTVTLADLTILGGLSSGGAGLYCLAASVIIQNCIFRDCIATGFGGAVYAAGAACMLEFIGCLFLANKALNSDGGAIFAGEMAAIYLTACLFKGNIAGRYGGALYFSFVVAHLIRCTFFGNSAMMAGACIATIGTLLPVVACILAYSIAGSAIHDESRTEEGWEFSCSNIFGNAGGDWTPSIAGQLGLDGNISLDPAFCSTDDSGDNLSLQSDSPCQDCDGEPMGVYGVGCGESRVGVSNWSLVKAIY